MRRGVDEALQGEGRFERLAPGSGRNDERDFHGGKRSNATRVSTDDPEAQLYRKPPGPGQQAPLTPEYQAVYEANLAKARARVAFDPKYICGPVGMPRVMALGTMEFIVKPTVVYMLLESTSPLRRIYTDGRAWPKDLDPSYVGYSIGKWLDIANDVTPTTFEIETRAVRPNA